MTQITEKWTHFLTYNNQSAKLRAKDINFVEIIQTAQKHRKNAHFIYKRNAN